MFLLVEPPRPSLPFDPVFLVPALPPVLTRPIGRSLPYGPHQHHHRALNPILGFSNDPGRDGFDTSAVTAAELLRENNSTTSGIVFARVALEVESASRNTLADRSGPIETYCSSTVSSSAVGRKRSNRRPVCGDRGNVSLSRSRSAKKLSAVFVVMISTLFPSSEIRLRAYCFSL